MTLNFVAFPFYFASFCVFFFSLENTLGYLDFHIVRLAIVLVQLERNSLLRR